MVSGPVAPSGPTYTLTETLHITSAGKITVASELTLNITKGAGLIMESGAQIVGDASGAAGVGATIVVDAEGDIILRGSGATGATITANQVGAGSCSGGHGGNIMITTKGSLTTEAGSLIATNAKCSAGEIELQRHQDDDRRDRRVGEHG